MTGLKFLVKLATPVLKIVTNLIDPFWSVSSKYKAQLHRAELRLVQRAALINFPFWTLLAVGAYVFNDNNKVPQEVWFNFRFSLAAIFASLGLLALFFRNDVKALKLLLLCLAASVSFAMSFAMTLGYPVRSQWMILLPALIFATYARSYFISATFLIIFVVTATPFWSPHHPLTFVLTELEIVLGLLLFLTAGRQLWIENQIYQYKLRHDLAIATILSDVARQVAHDIRSPLAALRTISENTPGIDDDLKEIITASTKRIRGIADHLLRTNEVLLKKASGSDEPETLIVSASESTTTEDIVQLLSEIVLEKRAQVSSRLDQIKFEFVSDRQRIDCAIQKTEFSRAISNIIDNSIEAIKHSGRIKIVVKRENEFGLITVTDTGIGMPQEIIPSLTYLGRSYNKPQGTGIGLLHARRSLEAWGGSIAIKSEINRGTEVAIQVPTADRSSDPHNSDARL